MNALARSSIHFVTSVSAGPPFGGLYLKPPYSRRIVGRRHDDAVGQPVAAAAVVRQDRVGNDGGRRVAAGGVHPDLHAVFREHLERAREGRLRQRVGVDPEEERPVDPLPLPVEADRLRDGEDVRLVERVVERRAAVPRRAECDALRRHRRIRLLPCSTP